MSYRIVIELTEDAKLTTAVPLFNAIVSKITKTAGLAYIKSAELDSNFHTMMEYRSTTKLESEVHEHVEKQKQENPSLSDLLRKAREDALSSIKDENDAIN